MRRLAASTVESGADREIAVAHVYYVGAAGNPGTIVQ